jgi:hypothetical protein
MAPWVTNSLVAAWVKLKLVAAASKATRAFKGGKVLVFSGMTKTHWL